MIHPHSYQAPEWAANGCYLSGQTVVVNWGEEGGGGGGGGVRG